MVEVSVDLWTEVVSQLRRAVGSDVFDNWFGSMRLESWQGQELVVSVDGVSRKEWLEEHYLSLMRTTCEEMLGVPVEITISLQQPGRNATVGVQCAQGTGSEPTTWGASRVHSPSGGRSSPEGVSDGSGKQPSTLYPVPKSRPPAQERAAVSDGDTPRSIRVEKINDRYQFESFVRGPSNELAYSVAFAVAESPGRGNNPLFLYGGCGLGKTHLMHAIGNHVRRRHPHLVVVYVPAEEFVNEFIDATLRNARQRFHARFRSVDVLLIDDIHSMAGKEGSQEQFFHTFNALYNAQKQIVVSCDRPPRDIPMMEDRLRSRFEGGMIADISPPDTETRMAILRQKCREENIRITDEVAEYVAERIRSNVRQLEGALIRLAAHASTYKIELVTKEVATQVLADLISRDDAVVSTDRILDVVCKHFRVRVSDVLGSRRTRMHAVPRRIAMYLARQLTKHSFPEIGALFGNKDHSTVMHACKRVDDEMMQNEDLRMTIDRLTRQIKTAP